MTTSAHDAVTLQQLINTSNSDALGLQLSKMVQGADNPDAMMNTAFQKLRLDSRDIYS